jgi:hypothetical protein
MEFKVAKRLATLKLRPIIKILLKYPTLLKNMNLKNLHGLKAFAFQNQVYKSYLRENVYPNS